MEQNRIFDKDEKPLVKRERRRTVTSAETKANQTKYTKNALFYINKARELAEKGYGDRDICKGLGISMQTYYNWQKKYIEFRDAILEGKEPIDHEVENALFKKTQGYWVDIEEDIIVDGPNGSTTTKKIAKKYYAPDTIACIFWLKNRQPEKWRDKIENANVANVTINVDKTDMNL